MAALRLTRPQTADSEAIVHLSDEHQFGNESIEVSSHDGSATPPAVSPIR